MKNITFSIQLKRILFFILIFIISVGANKSIAQVDDTTDGHYCPGPGTPGDEYADGFTFIPDVGVSGTCTVEQAWALIDYGNEVFRLGFKNGNSGNAIFRIYLDTDDSPLTGLLTDDMGGGAIPVPGAEIILQIQANNGSTTFFEATGPTTKIILGTIPGLFGNNGNSDGCAGSDGQFFEFNIPFTVLDIDICDPESQVIRLGHYAAVSGGSTTSNLCSNEPLDFDIDVSGVVTPDQSLCDGGPDATQLTLEISGQGNTIEGWQTRFNVGAWANIVNTIDTYTPPGGLSIGVHEYRAVLSNENICPGVNFFSSAATITVNPGPTVVATNDGPVCYSVTNFFLNETGGDATQWAWSSNGAADFNDASAQSPSVTNFVDGEVFTVVITDGNGCISSDSTTIILFPEPTAQATNDGPVCYSVTSFFLNETGGDATQWTWSSNGTAVISDTSVQNPSVTGFVDGEVFTVVITDGNGCITLDTTTIILLPEPTTQATNNSPVCYDTTNITLNETGGDATQWAWGSDGAADFSDANVQSPSVTNFVNGEVFTVVITDANGCISVDTTTITVNLAPIAPVSSGDISECEQSPIQTLDANDAITVPADVGYIWYDAATDGNIIVNPNDAVLNTVGTVTYWAEAINATTSCASSTRTPVTLTIYDCSISIDKTADSNDTQNCNPIASGGDIDYTFTVTNLGNVDITDVLVNDPLIDPINPIPGPDSESGSNDGILNVGETWTFTASYTVLQSDIDNGQVDNTAEVIGTVTGSSSSYSVDDNDSETVVLCQNAEISIIKLSDGDTVNCNPYEVNNPINYTFTVTNEGDVDITDVVVNDPLLGGDVAGPALGDDGNGILNVGEVWTYNAIYNVTQANIDAGIVSNTATVNGDTILDSVNDTSNTVDLEICQDTSDALNIVKAGVYDDGGDCSQPGEGIDYTFTVTNTSNVSISNIVVSDPILWFLFQDQQGIRIMIMSWM